MTHLRVVFSTHIKICSWARGLGLETQRCPQQHSLYCATCMEALFRNLRHSFRDLLAWRKPVVVAQCWHKHLNGLSPVHVPPPFFFRTILIFSFCSYILQLFFFSFRFWDYKSERVSRHSLSCYAYHPSYYLFSHDYNTWLKSINYDVTNYQFL